MILAARNDDEIIKTIEHYQARGQQVPFPDGKDFSIHDVEHVNVLHFLPMLNLEEEFVDINPVSDITFQVHPNAIADLMFQLQDYENMLRGGLYKINPRRSLENYPPLDKLEDPRLACYFFLPKDAVEALAHYKWEPLLEKYAEERIRTESKLKRHPNIGLSNTLKNTVRKLRADSIIRN